LPALEYLLPLKCTDLECVCLSEQHAVVLGAASADVVKVAAARACTSNSCMQRSAGMFERSRVPGSNVKDRVWKHGCAVLAASAYVQLVQMMLGLNQFFSDMFMLHGLYLA
jgi:hypothetical protein